MGDGLKRARAAARKTRVKAEVLSDGSTVWVNGPNGMMGRFNRQFLDVHINGVCAGDGCTPGPCSLEHWKTFKAKMLEIHGVRISDKHMPTYLNS
jgi:hypothetical protein